MYWVWRKGKTSFNYYLAARHYIPSYHRYHCLVLFPSFKCTPTYIPGSIPFQNPMQFLNQITPNKESREHMTMKSLQSRIAARPRTSHARAVSIAAPAFEVLVPTTFPLTP